MEVVFGHPVKGPEDRTLYAWLGCRCDGNRISIANQSHRYPKNFKPRNRG